MRKCKLGDILQFHRGYDLPISEMEKGDYPVVGSSGINGYHSSYTTEAPSVSVGRSGNSAGKAFIYYGKTWTHNTALFVSKFKNCNPVYAYYLLKSINLSDYATGSAVPTLNRNHIHDIDIQIPDTIQEQNKIANILKAIDDKIEINENKIDILESMAKTLYDYWFVQFDFPDANGRPYKTSGGKMEWNETLSREIPAGWDVVTIGDLVDCNVNTVSIKDFQYPINYLDTSNITENRLGNIQVIYSEEDTPSRARRIVQENDIIISTVRPNLHHYGFIKSMEYDVVASTGYAILSPKNEKYASFCYRITICDEVQKTLDKIAQLSVSSYPSFNPDDLLTVKIAVPIDLTIVERFSRKLDTYYEIISQKEHEIKKLVNLREYLLPMLMNGQVTFRQRDFESGVQNVKAEDTSH